DPAHQLPARWDQQRIRNVPVTGVSYWEVCAYCAWLANLLGRAVRLPSEAEWERAARGPAQLTAREPRFPWGEAWDPRRPSCAERGFEHALSVGLFEPGPEGLWDIAGNVMEWCGDAIAPGLRDVAVRGGSFRSHPLDLRVSVRNALPPEARAEDLGFRC